ncbi:MAG: family 78 glycoside hydrolase catalytic domain [Protaetiibacter sp.]
MSQAPTALRTALRRDPFGIAVSPPEFAWQVAGGAGQAAWEIELRDSEALIWHSGMVAGSQPFGIRYAGDPLRPRTGYRWRVRLRLDDGSVTPFSDTAVFETGLGEDEWTASWITAPGTGGKSDVSALHLRTTAELPAEVVRGRAYVSALGWYRFAVNDRDLTEGALVPRWSPFHDYVEYQAYDVTDAFRAGGNTVGVIVAEGRWRGRVGAFARPRIYGDRLAAIAHIVLELADGSTTVIDTDGSWRSASGRTSTADPMTGERADLRIPEWAWLDPATPAGPAEVLPGEWALRPETVERVRPVGRLRGSVSRTPSGVQLVDFGQNFAGVARVRLSGTPGSRVVLQYGEVLTTSGELATDYLRIPGVDRKVWFQRDEVVLGPEPVEYQAALTIHGFRYLAVVGPADPLRDDEVEGVVISTDLDPISEFTASDPRLEQLWRNVTWSLRSNFTDTPSDCPTRERSGWTGDIQVFGPTAAQLVDADAYLRRYLRNLALEQFADGRVPPFIPAEESPGRRRSPLRFTSTAVGWGDAAVMLPWALYRYYGDVGVLRDQYDSATRWVDGLARRARTRRSLRRRLGRGLGELEHYIVDTGYHWGEWLRPGETLGSEMPGNLLGKRTSVATAYLAHSSRLLSQIAEVLGRPDDAAAYASLAAETKHAWQAAFVRDGGARIGDDKQDDYVRALAFELLEDPARERAAERLAELVEAAGFHLGTGFLSTPMLLPALVDAGYPEHAMRILLQDTTPSWLAQIARGATTIWETWEGYRPDGEPEASHNHYSFGSVVAFLQERVAGLAPIEPGYRRFRVEPVIGHGITHASTAVRTPYGRAAVAWRLDGDDVAVEVTVPPGAEAEVRIGGVERSLPAGDHSLRVRRTGTVPRGASGLAAEA